MLRENKNQTVCRVQITYRGSMSPRGWTAFCAMRCAWPPSCRHVRAAPSAGTTTNPHLVAPRWPQLVSTAFLTSHTRTKKKVFSKHGLPHTLTTGEHVSTHTDTRRGIQQHTAIARGKIRGGNIVGTSQPTIPPKLPDGVCPQNWPFFFNEKLVVNTVKISFREKKLEGRTRI